jgi:hypothetical protein
MHYTLCKWWPAVLAVAPVLSYAQTTPKLTDEQIEKFLQNAKIVKIKNIGTGVTHTRRATLDDGTMQHDAHLQNIDEHKDRFQGETGTEINFVDTWKYNVAAYRLGRLLDLDMIPVSVERKVEGTACACTWWIDNSIMESERLKKKEGAPDPDKWNQEMYVVRVFDQLIYNMDRNLTNLLIDPEWRIWMIDHTRAFRLYTNLKEKKNLVQCDRKLLAKLRTLDAKSLESLKPYVNSSEIKGVLGRRDKIVEFFDAEVKAKGESAVLYDRPAR